MLAQKCQVSGRQAGLGEQIGALLQGAQQRLLSAPTHHVGMVSADQDGGHTVATKGKRACVLRAFEQAIQAGRMAILVSAGIVAQSARLQTCNGIDQDHGSQFTAADHVVAEADFVRCQLEAHPFVDPLVAPTDQSDPVLLCQFCDDALGQRPPLRAQKDHWQRCGQCGRGVWVPVGERSGRGLHRQRPAGGARQNGFECSHDRFGFHDHSAAAAVGCIIADVVAVGGEVANVVEANRNQCALQCPGDDALPEWADKHCWEEGEEIEVDAMKGSNLSLNRFFTGIRRRFSGFFVGQHANSSVPASKVPGTSLFQSEDRPSGRSGSSVPQARGTAQVILPTTTRPKPSWIPLLVRGGAACALLAASSWLIWARGSADDRAAEPAQVVVGDSNEPEPVLDTVLGLRPTFTPTSAATPTAIDSSELAQIEIVTPTPDPGRSLRVAGAPVERFAAAIPSIGKQPELMGLFPIELQALQPVLPAPPQTLVDLAELPTVFEEVVNGPLSQIQLFTLEGVHLTVDPKPTPTAVPVLAAEPTELSARMPPPLTLAGPTRVWASFQPKLPEENDHFWIESPFLNTEFNKVAAPSYQFGSTAGGQYRPHHGIDIANRWGTPVRAAAPGVVVFAGLDDPIAMGPYPNFYGNTVVIQLDRKLPVAGGEIDVFLLYGHLSRVTVTQGQRVAPDDIVGEVGMKIGRAHV